MDRVFNLVLRLKVWRDTGGQDFIEYALMVAFIAVTGGAVIPPVAEDIQTIFSKARSVLGRVDGS